MGNEDLAERLERVERRLAVYDLIASYGPAVDSGSSEVTADLWDLNGTYDFGEGVLEGRSAVEAMVRGRPHQSLINAGAAHVLGFPKVDLQGDRAVATGYSQVCRFEEGRFVLWRVSANRWELLWDGAGWKVVSRTARLLDGRESARVLLCG